MSDLEPAAAQCGLARLPAQLRGLLGELEHEIAEQQRLVERAEGRAREAEGVAERYLARAEGAERQAHLAAASLEQADAQARQAQERLREMERATEETARQLQAAQQRAEAAERRAEELEARLQQAELDKKELGQQALRERAALQRHLSGQQQQINELLHPRQHQAPAVRLRVPARPAVQAAAAAPELVQEMDALSIGQQQQQQQQQQHQGGWQAQKADAPADAQPAASAVAGGAGAGGTAGAAATLEVIDLVGDDEEEEGQQQQQQQQQHGMDVEAAAGAHEGAAGGGPWPASPRSPRSPTSRKRLAELAAVAAGATSSKFARPASMTTNGAADFLAQSRFSADADSREKLNYAVLEFVKALAAENQFCYFREPVTEREAPDYLAVISHPMDFGTIANRAAAKLYTRPDLFKEDMLLIVSNAKEYNKKQHPVHKAAVMLQDRLDKPLNFFSKVDTLWEEWRRQT